MTQLTCFQISLYIVCVGLIITTFEQLSRIKDYKEGFFRWDLSSNRPQNISNPFLSRLLNILTGEQFLIYTLYLRLLALFLCVGLTSFLDVPSYGLLIFISISLLLFNFRNSKGLDGSDQMFAIVTITITFWSIDVFDNYLCWTCMLFLAGQATLAYTTAGIAKLVSPTWKSGNATIMIMDTQTFGNKRISGFLLDNLKFNKLLARYIILWESLFVLSFLSPVTLIIFLISGFCFHLYNAFIMGLNGFLWSFLATYPSIIFICFSLNLL